MAESTRRPPRNRDLERPRRVGETIEPVMPPERGQSERERERKAPLQEEETYERETPSGRRRDQS